MEFLAVEDVLGDVSDGKLIMLSDDSQRENEGDLMLAAEKVSPEALAFMMREGRGLICLSLDSTLAVRLSLPLQVTQNKSIFGTNFTVSIDHLSVAENGVSASARAKTIQRAVSSDVRADEFSLPGYVFPLRAVDGGVLRRRGQTEGSVDLARLAGLKPAGVICEVLDENGEPRKGSSLREFCDRFGIKATNIEEICKYRLRNEIAVRRVDDRIIDDVVIPQSAGRIGCLRVITYVDDFDAKEHYAFLVGAPRDGCLVRMHSECLTGDVLHSRRCDCHFQFETALGMFFEEGSGVLVYLNQEGRGIGLGNKLQAYELQDEGLDTVDANVRLGFAPDLRSYRAGARILGDLGLKTVRVITNNPDKIRALEEYGMEVLQRVPSEAPLDEWNGRYLRSKRERLGHLLPASSRLP